MEPLTAGIFAFLLSISLRVFSTEKQLPAPKNLSVKVVKMEVEKSAPENVLKK